MVIFFRVLLHLVQAVLVLLALYFTVRYLLWIFEFDEELTPEPNSVVFAAMGCGIVSAACSPSLWLGRSSKGAPPPPTPAGSYDRVTGQPPAVPQPPQPGGVGFEPMAGDRAPAPPASSYGQPAAGNFGGPPQQQQGGPAQSSPPQGETPWGNNR